MKEVDLNVIRQNAAEYHAAAKSWHFHIMSPVCVFNKSDRFAFVLEGPEQTYVHYSDRAEKELGQELAPSLHGDKILDAGSTNTKYVPSSNVMHMIKRAKQLNADHVAWHHHMLFPNCSFNFDSSKYVLVFEDPETGDTLTNLTDKEPVDDLKQIEYLFYK